MTGGRGRSDGVRRFMTANGFNRFIEQKDFQDPVFKNAWGVSDEDLFARAVQELYEMHAQGRPFLAVLLTVSNHRPYTFPAGRVAETDSSRENAVKYADWALGRFFEEARRHEFYRDTLFVVMGDHGARVYGSQLFPMKSYRVPALFLLPEEKHRDARCHTLACSLDVAPTIMGLLGGSYRSVFFGRDALCTPPSHGYALMQHNHDLALLDSRNRMVVLRARQDATGYALDPRTAELTRTGQADRDMRLDAIAFFQTANRLYYDDCCFPGEGGDGAGTHAKFKAPGQSSRLMAKRP